MYVTLAILELALSTRLDFASRVLGLKVCATIPG